MQGGTGVLLSSYLFLLFCSKHLFKYLAALRVIPEIQINGVHINTFKMRKYVGFKDNFIQGIPTVTNGNEMDA